MICGTAKFIDSSTNKIWANQERQKRFCLYMPGSKGFKRYACLLQCFFQYVILNGSKSYLFLHLQKDD